MQKKLNLLIVGLAAAALMGCADATSSSSNPNGQSGPAGTGQSGAPNGNTETDGTGSSAADGVEAVSIGPQNAMIEFVGSKPDGSSHDGGFREFSGEIHVDPEKGSVSRIALTIQTASLWADVEKLENHLKSPDFFNVRERPTAVFMSTDVRLTDAETGKHEVSGDLTLLGVTKSIQFPAMASYGDDGLRLNSAFEIDRTEFGMDYGEGRINSGVAITVRVGGEETERAGNQ